ncbi:MAG: hypothetical protein QM733_08090 [Ilumatobacteraceae bacterium]
MTTVADVSIVKTPLDAAVVAGDVHGYQLSVTNNGPSVARAVTVTDPLPAGTTLVAVEPTEGSCAASGSDISCDLGDLAPGEVVNVQLTVSVSAGLGDTDLTNTATVASTTPDPAPGDNSSSVTQRVTRRADLALTKAITSGSIVAGANVTYTLTLRNDGPSDTIDAELDDQIPAGTTFVSAAASDGGTCALVPLDSSTTPVTPARARCTWATLAAGATRTATVAVAVPAGTAEATIVHNEATASSPAIDPTPNTATADGPVVLDSDVSITKSLVFGNTAGSAIRWQLVVRNSGPSTAAGVTVADPAPAGVTYSAAASTVGTCDIAAAPLCQIGTLAVGATATITLDGTVDPGWLADVANTATVSSTSNDDDLTNNTSTTTTDLGTSADVGVVKTANTPFVAGQNASWTVTVTNEGPSVSRSVVVTDAIPAGLAGVTAVSSVGIGCDVDSTTIRCPLGDIGVGTGAAATVTISGTIGAGFLAGSMSNTATVAAGTTDPDPTDNSSGVTSPVSTSADLGMVKTGPATAVPGSPVTWSIAVSNAGPSVAQGAVVTDVLPPGLVAPSVSVGGVQCAIAAPADASVSSGTATCNLGAVPVGTSVATVTVTATVAPGALGSLTNSASVSASTTDPDPDGNASSVTTTLEPGADVSVTKVADADADAEALVPGSPAGWTIVVSNAGPSVARSLSVQDTLPAGVTATAVTIDVIGQPTVTCPPAATLDCAIGDLGPGVQARVHIAATIAADVTVTPMVNTATLATGTDDPTTDDHTATSSTPVVPSADVWITKTITPPAPTAGAEITYTLVVGNAGPSDAHDVLVTDALPGDLELAGLVVTPGAPACALDERDLTCQLGTLPASSAPITITVSGTLAPTATGVVANTATVVSSTADPNTANNSSSADADPNQLADLSVTKTAAPAGGVLAGNEITWTVTVHNAGPSDATAVHLVDTLPPGLTDVGVTASAGGTCSTPVTAGFTCDWATLADDGDATVTVTATVDSGSLATSLINSARVSSAVEDPDGADNIAAVTTAVAREASLVVTKSVDASPIVPGRSYVYTIEVRNTGPSDADATVSQDQLDPMFTLEAPATPSQGACTFDAQVLNCRLGIVRAGATATVTIPVHVDPTTTQTSVTNTAIVATATPTPDGEPVAPGTITTDVTPLADLTLTKSGPATVTAGTAIAWSLTATNAGPSMATGVVVTDTLPPGLGAMTVVPGQGSCTLDGDTITCALGNLTPGAQVGISVSGTVPAGYLPGDIENSATLTSPTPEADPTDPDGRSATATTTVDASADVAVAKRADVDPAVPGEAVHWTVTVSNAGPSVARDVMVTDTLPTGLADVVLAGPAGVTCSSAGVCTIPSSASAAPPRS